MDENNGYGFISDYAIGIYNWVTDLSKPSKFSSVTSEDNNFIYEFNSNNGSLNLTIPYF